MAGGEAGEWLNTHNYITAEKAEGELGLRRGSKRVGGAAVEGGGR